VVCRSEDRIQAKLTDSATIIGNGREIEHFRIRSKKPKTRGILGELAIRQGHVLSFLTIRVDDHVLP
jgi:hypothetical protein